MSKKVDNMLKADMAEYIKELEAKNKALAKSLESKSPVEQESEPVQPQTVSQEEYVEIRPDRYVKVVSLCPNPLTLTTQINGGGKTFRFRELGEFKRILYQDLVDIMEASPTFTEHGVFYIADKDVIRRHGLDDAYAKVITKEQIETVMSGYGDTAFAIFQSANERQQSYLVDMLVKKIVDGENVDRNFVHLVSQETGINIDAKATEEKEYKDILTKEE